MACEGEQSRGRYERGTGSWGDGWCGCRRGLCRSATLNKQRLWRSAYPGASPCPAAAGRARAAARARVGAWAPSEGTGHAGGHTHPVALVGTAVIMKVSTWRGSGWGDGVGWVVVCRVAGEGDPRRRGCCARGRGAQTLGLPAGVRHVSFAELSLAAAALSASGASGRTFRWPGGIVMRADTPPLLPPGPLDETVNSCRVGVARVGRGVGGSTSRGWGAGEGRGRGAVAVAGGHLPAGWVRHLDTPPPSPPPAPRALQPRLPRARKAARTAVRRGLVTPGDSRRLHLGRAVRTSP